MWYELVASASALPEDIEKPDWLIRIAESELEFYDAVRLLSRYSLVEEVKEECSSYSMHSVLHEWCCQLSEARDRDRLCWLATGLVSAMVPESEDEYWKLRRRLLPHGSRVYRWVTEAFLEQSDEVITGISQAWEFDNLGILFAHRGKLAEAEKCGSWR